MRETGLVRFRYIGDKELAQQRVSIGRTLLGRMKSYLGQARGAHTWQLDDGTVFRTRFYGDVQIVEIDVRGVERQHKLGYYFIYLFGGPLNPGTATYDNVVLGWRVERGTDKVTPIAGMPFPMANPGEGLVTNADNFRHGPEIVVGMSPTRGLSTPGDMLLYTYRADAANGQLTLHAVTDVSPLYIGSIRDNRTGPLATQVKGKYLLVGWNNETIDDRWALYDSGAGTVVHYTSEPAFSYVGTTVGASHHHPTKKVFYRADGNFVYAYSYEDPEDPPTLEGTFEVPTLPGVSTDTFAVAPDGSALIEATFWGGWNFYGLSEDGKTFLGAGIRNPPVAYSLGPYAMIAAKVASGSVAYTMNAQTSGTPGRAMAGLQLVRDDLSLSSAAWFPHSFETRMHGSAARLLDSSRVIFGFYDNAFDTSARIIGLKPTVGPGYELAFDIDLPFGAVTESDAAFIIAIYEPEHAL